MAWIKGEGILDQISCMGGGSILDAVWSWVALMAGLIFPMPREKVCVTPSESVRMVVGSEKFSYHTMFMSCSSCWIEPFMPGIL